MKTTPQKKSVSKKATAKTKRKLDDMSEVNQKQFENVLLHSPNIFIILKGFPKMTIAFANEPLYRSWGKTADIIGKPLMEVVPEIKDQTFPVLLQQVFKTGKTHYSSEERAVIHINGNPFDKYYNYVYQPIFDKNQKVTGVTVMASDITELVFSRKKIEESEEKYRTLLTSIDMGFTLCELIRNKEGKGIDMYIQEVNQTYEEQTGISKEIVIGKPLLQIFPSLSKWIPIYTSVVDNQQHAEFENYFEETERWFSIKAYPLEKDRFAVLFSDITRQKQASQYSRSLIEASLDPLVTVNVDGKISDVNEASIKVTGVEREKLINTNFSNYFTEPKKAEEGYQLVFEKGFVADYPLTIKHKNGNLTDVLYNASVYKNDKGTVLGVFAAARDVTEQKKAVEKIKKSEIALEQIVEQRTSQLAKKNQDLLNINRELESFNYISSHDLQEPLRQIQIFSSRINEGELKHLSDASKTYFEKINNAANRMQNIINDLLSYSRTKTEVRKFENINLNQIINEVIEEFEEVVFEKQATFAVAEMGNANVITFQFRQLMYNLIGNALKFSKPDTPPHIVIKNEKVKSNQLLDLNEISETEYYHISIADNGIGFEQQYKDRIFEVFQRLHDKQKIAGTGIGLAIVKNIVENHNGIIKATGELNKGATFDIYIPTIQSL